MNSRSTKKKIRLGNENADKIFYVVAYEWGASGGLLWIILCNLTHIHYAVSHGYIPIIDLQNYRCHYLRDDDFEQKNAWEYYFNQPVGYNLTDIQKSKNIILNKEFQSDMDNVVTTLNFWDKTETINFYSKIYKKYVTSNKKVMEYFNCEYNSILAGKGKVLGVLCRGTDYLYVKPHGHPVQPLPVDVVNRARQIMLEKKYSYLYLSTEDKDIYDLFSLHFGSKLLANKQNRLAGNVFEHTDAKWLGEITKNQDSYLKGLEYLSSINLLSKCDSFIGGNTAGTIGVYLMAEKEFEYEFIWHLGTWL
jgi:hypothetical protein